MIVTGTRAHGLTKRRPIDVNGTTFYKSEWMECGADPALSPTVFLVEQPPNTELVSHFHRQNQFQLFVDGAGSIGRETLGAVTVHYAGAYTGRCCRGRRGFNISRFARCARRASRRSVRPRKKCGAAPSVTPIRNLWHR